jgi:hypothetical protein
MPLDLDKSRKKLEALFKSYPAGNHCDVCADKVGKELKEAGFEVEIVTIQNEQIPGQPGARPPYVQARKPDGSPFLLGQVGFHQTNRVQFEGVSYFIDALVYLHYGVQAVDEDTYFSLFVYPDGVEITDVEVV